VDIYPELRHSITTCTGIAICGTAGGSSLFNPSMSRATGVL